MKNEIWNLSFCRRFLGFIARRLIPCSRRTAPLTKPAACCPAVQAPPRPASPL